MTGLSGKIAVLRAIMKQAGPAAVAFSGGTDSTLLLKMAIDGSGPGVLAVTALSPTLPEAEKAEAASLARTLGAVYVPVETHEMDLPGFSDNPPERCYVCKRHRYRAIRDLAGARGVATVVDGENADDDADVRPGRRAARESGILSPLREAGLTKAEIRSVSETLGLPTARKPSSACLASRIPYGTPITADKLRMIDRAEAFLKDLGIFHQIRVRWEGDRSARIEVDTDAVSRLAHEAVGFRVTQFLKSLGFFQVAIDPAGYRTGSLNPVREGRNG